MKARTERFAFRALVLAAIAIQAGCLPAAKKPCHVTTLPGMRTGYEIVWTARVDYEVFNNICLHQDPSSLPGIHFEVALIRGTGSVHMGSNLRRELEPRLDGFKLDGWRPSCLGKVYSITLNAQEESCNVDRIIEAIGQYLRERNSSDFVVLSMGLWSAPAL